MKDLFNKKVAAVLVFLAYVFVGLITAPDTIKTTQVLHLWGFIPFIMFLLLIVFGAVWGILIWRYGLFDLVNKESKC
jgi:hypothetical protein